MKTQLENVLTHLKKRKKITSWEAIQLYHCTRLAAVIYLLKDAHDILAVRMHDPVTGKRWAEYRYLGAK